MSRSFLTNSISHWKCPPISTAIFPKKSITFDFWNLFIKNSCYSVENIQIILKVWPFIMQLVSVSINESYIMTHKYDLFIEILWIFSTWSEVWPVVWMWSLISIVEKGSITKCRTIINSFAVLEHHIIVSTIKGYFVG